MLYGGGGDDDDDDDDDSVRVAGLVVTDEPKGPILCWTRPLTRTPNLKSL